MDNPTFYGLDGRLDLTTAEYLEIRSTVGAGSTPMIEIVAVVGPKRATVFLPAETAEKVAAALLRAARDAEVDAGVAGLDVPPHPRAVRG